MIGAHTIKINDNRVKYEFTIKRNITIIRGGSATGKTTLLQMLDNYDTRKKHYKNKQQFNSRQQRSGCPRG